MKLNNKGFSLVEVLAVIVILSIVAAIAVPTVTNIIKSNEAKSMENLTKSIISSAKIYISENRYNISLTNSCNEVDKDIIAEINGTTIYNSNIPLSLIAESGDLDNEIVNPNDRKQTYDLNTSYITITFNCKTKKYIYGEVTLN